jgi:hypothetical protein
MTLLLFLVSLWSEGIPVGAKPYSLDLTQVLYYPYSVSHQNARQAGYGPPLFIPNSNSHTESGELRLRLSTTMEPYIRSQIIGTTSLRVKHTSFYSTKWNRFYTTMMDPSNLPQTVFSQRKCLKRRNVLDLSLCGLLIKKGLHFQILEVE